MSAPTNKHPKPEQKPEKARSSWRRPSQTTRILENVELLIALHESQENEGHGELARLTHEFESWKKESHELLEETNSLVAEVEKQTTQQLARQLDAKAGDFVKTVASQISERFDSLDHRVSEIAETVCKQQGSGQKQNLQSKDQDLDIADLLSQQGQELEARFELFTEHFDAKTDRVLESVTASAGSQGDCRDDSSLEKRLEELGQRIAKITELVEHQPTSSVTDATVSDAAVLTKLSQQQQSDLAENIELVTDHFDEKTKELASSIQMQFELQLEQRFEKLNDHVIKITSALAGQQALLESGNASASGSGSLVIDQVNEKIEAIANSFNSRIDDLFGSLGNRISQVSEGIARQESNLDFPAAVENGEDSAIHWHQQKTAMLSKYGIDPNYRPLMEISDKTANEADESEFEEVSDNLESLHNSIENISAADAEAIENLKEDLTSKLRDAEVEFSINRAKLSQLKAELDDKQVELDRRAAALEEKFGGLSSSAKKSGFLDRLARHLSLRKSDPLGD